MSTGQPLSLSGNWGPGVGEEEVRMKEIFLLHTENTSSGLTSTQQSEAAEESWDQNNGAG